MKSLFVASFVAFVSSFLPSALAQDTLAWKFQSGESLKYTVVQKTNMEMNVAGQQAQSMTMAQTIDMLWRISKVESDGIAEMAQVVERVQMTSEGGPFGTVKFDSANNELIDSPLAKSMADVFKKIIGQEFVVTMQPTGKIKHVEVPPALLKSLTDAGAAGNTMNEETLRQMMTQSAVTLPSQAVKMGDSWVNTQTVELPFGAMIVMSDLKYQGADSGTAEIAITPRVDVKPKEGAPINLKLFKSEGDGTVMFDISRGRISSSKLDLRLDLQVTQFGKTVNMKLHQITNMNLTP